MPIKIVRDYREFLIDIFFAVIIAVGLDRFLHSTSFDTLHDIYIHKLNPISSQLNFESISKLFSTTSTPSTPSGISIMFDMLFFFAAYFWVISHWVFYHELITKYPYYRWRKFFVDIALFTIMFFILNISYSVHNIVIAELFVWLLIVWYVIAFLWHLSDWHLRPLHHYLWRHILRLITYIPLLLFLYITPPDPVHYLYRCCIMILVIAAMIGWSVERLWRFIRQDSRWYLCDHLKDYPRMDSYERGELEVISHPMKEKFGGDKNSKKHNGEDIIIFHRKKKDDFITICPEDITEVGVRRVSDDLILRINCRYKIDGKVKDGEVFFNLADLIIGSVSKGIEDLSNRNQHGDST